MAVKSVVEIDVNDAAWKRFQAAWQSFQKALGSKPFAAFNQGIVAASQQQVTAQQRVTTQIKGQLQLIKEEGRELTRQVTVWNTLATKARDFSDHIRGALGFLSRTIPFSTALAGILGVGSLWGLDRMAGTVGAGRRGAQGLGVSYGEARAFRLNYERLVDAPGFLQGVASALSSPGGAVPLGALGFSQRALQGVGAAQAAAELLPAIKRLADRTPQNLLASVLTAYHLDELGITVEDLRRLRATSPGELAGIGASYRRDVGALGLQDATARAWQNFYIQMERAGDTIETVFVKKLTPLIPGLTALSGSIVKAIETFLGPSDRINAALAKLGHGIEWLAGYIGSDDFQTKIRNFVTGVGEFADSTVSLLRRFGMISTPGSVHTLFGGAAAAAPSPFVVPSYLQRLPSMGATGGVTMPLGPLNLGGSTAAALNAASGVDIKDLNPTFRANLAALIAAGEAATGEKARIVSGYRTYAQQYEIYLRHLNMPGGIYAHPAARPGHSRHELGLAADIAASPRLLQWLHEHARDKGLEFPLPSRDAGHIQATRTRVDIHIDNSAGANVFTTTNAVGQTP